MKDILEAIKDYILLLLQPKECPRCLALEEQLDYERRHSEYLQGILFRNARLVKEDEPTDTEELQSIRPRRIPWHLRRREVELKHRRPKEDKVEVTPKLTEAEQLFEKELKSASN